MTLRSLSLLAAATVAVLLLPAAAAVGASPFEFAGVFPIASTAGTTHTWSMQKATVGGAYADPAMSIVLIPGAGDKAALEADETAAETLVAGTCAVVNDGDTMTVAAGGSCFTLTVDDTKDDTTFTIDTTGITGLSIFTAHVPTEFERDTHYLYDAANTDIEPVWILGKTNAIFTCTKEALAAAADGETSAQTWTVQMKTACDHDCSVCDEVDSHTTDRGAAGLKNEVCMDEDHCVDGVCEKEYILFRCKDEADGVHVDMHVYEGAGIEASHCGTASYEDQDEYLEYESGQCKADGHGHHAHEDAYAEKATPQNAGSVLAFAPTVALVALAQQVLLGA